MFSRGICDAKWFLGQFLVNILETVCSITFEEWWSELAMIIANSCHSRNTKRTLRAYYFWHQSTLTFVCCIFPPTTVEFRVYLIFEVYLIDFWELSISQAILSLHRFKERKLQFLKMNILPLVKSIMEMGSLWKSKTYL